MELPKFKEMFCAYLDEIYNKGYDITPDIEEGLFAILHRLVTKLEPDIQPCDLFPILDRLKRLVGIHKIYIWCEINGFVNQSEGIKQKIEEIIYNNNR